jgi:hypothetical protein
MAKDYFDNQFQADDLNTETIKEDKKTTGKGSGQGFNMGAIAGIVVIVLILVGLTAWYMSKSLKAAPQTEQTFNTNIVIAQLKSQSILFCNNFFNLSYTTYKDARDRAQQSMTPNLLTQYKEIFYDTPFTDEITNSGLATDYTYNQVLKGVDPKQTAIKVIGSIKYTSTKKNVSVEMPITAVLIWVKDPNGVWKIDNLYLDM